MSLIILRGKSWSSGRALISNKAIMYGPYRIGHVALRNKNIYILISAKNSRHRISSESTSPNHVQNGLYVTI
jgi:hypothetical protein